MDIYYYNSITNIPNLEDSDFLLNIKLILTFYIVFPFRRCLNVLGSVFFQSGRIIFKRNTAEKKEY